MYIKEEFRCIHLEKKVVECTIEILHVVFPLGLVER